MKAVFSFPFIYPSKNRILGMGHWERYKVKKTYDTAMAASLNLAKPWPKFTGQVQIKVLLCFSKKRRRDFGNYEPFWLLDILVRAGILKDDSEKYLSERCAIAFIEGEKEQTTVVIEEIKIKEEKDEKEDV